jgi:hypothetical protein
LDSIGIALGLRGPSQKQCEKAVKRFTASGVVVRRRNERLATKDNGNDVEREDKDDKVELPPVEDPPVEVPQKSSQVFKKVWSAPSLDDAFPKLLSGRKVCVFLAHGYDVL